MLATLYCMRKLVEMFIHNINYIINNNTNSDIDDNDNNDDDDDALEFYDKIKYHFRGSSTT